MTRAPDPNDETPDDAIVGRVFWRALLALGVFGAGGGALWAVTRPDAPTATAPAAALPSAPVPASASGDTLPSLPFTEVSAALGVDFDRFDGARGERLLPETMGGGVTFFDHDADGDPDLLALDGAPWPGEPAPARRPTPRLWRNDAGRFVDITVEAGLDLTFPGMAAVSADVDADGDADLLLTGVGGLRLLRQSGGRYADATAEAGLADAQDAWTTAAVFFDADGDADLDLAVGEYVQWTRALDLSLESTLDGANRAYGPPNQFAGTFPRLYRNDGAGRFRNVSAEAGLQVRNPATGAPLAKTLGMTAVDLDADDDLDLVLANDTVQNFAFVQGPGGRFEEQGASLGLAFDTAGRARGAMGIAAAHAFDDDRLTIAIGNFANEMAALYQRAGAGTPFVDAAVPAGLGAPSRRALKFGLVFLDADLDGAQDLLLANGHIEPEIGRFQAGQTHAQAAQLFWNRGGAPGPGFAELPAEHLGALATPRVGRGLAVADIDADGDLDVAIAQPRGRLALLRNEQRTGNHWLRVRLRGAKPNLDAIGATVSIDVAGRRRTRTVMPYGSYLSQSEPVLTFGLGAAERVDALSVRWPGGRVQVEAPPSGVDRVLEIEAR